MAYELTIDLKGRIALVTGASGQLGRVIAKTLSRCRADVIIHYRSREREAKSLAFEIQATGGKAFCVKADITLFQSVLQMRDEIRRKVGDPNIVVTNAVSQVFPWTSVLEEEPTDYENQFQSCVMQNVYAAKAFVPAMIQKRWGRFIGINTECAVQLAPTQSAYAAAKRGMDGVLRVLAKEVGEHQVTVNQVAPGWISNEQEPASMAQASRQYLQRVPLQRRATSQEVAHAVAFLASDLASFISGAFIPVCGGNVMPGP